jgi:hypothetical protein
LSDEKRESAGASFAAYAVFPKFGQAPPGFCACQTGSQGSMGLYQVAMPRNAPLSPISAVL